MPSSTKAVALYQDIFGEVDESFYFLEKLQTQIKAFCGSLCGKSKIYKYFLGYSLSLKNLFTIFH